MAVMKTCCGCFSTKTGTYAVLLLYTAAYIACIVAVSLNLKGENYQTWYKESVLDSAEWKKECDGEENMKLWKCKTSYDMQWSIKGFFIGIVVACCFFIVAAILAIIGTAKQKHWPILPWIILEFIRLFCKLVMLTLVIILWAVNMKEDADESNLIATSVLGAVIVAFYFYVWLCVVSHFQTIKEISDLGLLDKGDSGDVLPFVHEDGYSNSSTVNSTVNMRDDDDDEYDDKEDADDKDELESINSDDDDDNKNKGKKDDDPEDPKERPKSTASKRAQSARSTTSSIVADTRPDVEEE